MAETAGGSVPRRVLKAGVAAAARLHSGVRKQEGGLSTSARVDGPAVCCDACNLLNFPN